MFRFTVRLVGLALPVFYKHKQNKQNLASCTCASSQACIRSPYEFISDLSLTALSKLEIAVCFFWLPLPVHSGSLRRIVLSAGSVNFHAKLKIHSTWGSTDLDEIYTVCRLYRVYSIPKIFLKTIT